MTDKQRQRIHTITYSTDSRDELAERIVELEDERDKLREMVCDVHEALRADKAGMFHKLTLASIEDDMRELGIEANYD